VTTVAGVFSGKVAGSFSRIAASGQVDLILKRDAGPTSISKYMTPTAQRSLRFDLVPLQVSGAM